MSFTRVNKTTAQARSAIPSSGCTDDSQTEIGKVYGGTGKRSILEYEVCTCRLRQMSIFYILLLHLDDCCSAEKTGRMQEYSILLQLSANFKKL